MSIRLCQACLHEIREGDKLCSNCRVSVNRHATVIEVMNEFEGYSYVSNRYAFHDENLNNYNQEILKDSKNSRLYPDNIKESKKENEEVVEFEYMHEDDSDFMKNFVKMINNPRDYKDILLGLLGSLLLIIGNIITIYNNIGTVRGNNNVYFNFVTVLIMANAFIAVLLVFKHKKKFILIPTIVTGMMLIFVTFDKETVQYIDMGYYIMWISLILLVCSATINTRNRVKKYFLRKKDLAWVMLTFFVSLGLVNTFNYYYRISTVEAGEDTGTIITKTIRVNQQDVKNVYVDEEHMKVEISLLDSYLVRYEGKDLIVVEMSLFNKGLKPIKISDYLDVFVKQNDERIDYEKNIENMTYFELNRGDEKLRVNKCKTVFLGFYVEEKGDSYLNIVNKKKNKSIINQIIALNSKFYVQENVSISADGESEKEEQKENKKYSIYFRKPSNWSENIYAYIYYVKDDDVVEIGEWPGVKMNKEGTMYKIKYDKKWYGKAKVLIVDKEDNNNIFPGKRSLGLKLEGNINIMPNEK